MRGQYWWIILVWSVFSIGHVSIGHAEELPSSLVCSGNAKAVRDYALAEGRWEGGAGAPRTAFAIATSGRPSDSNPLREKVFSRLGTDAPMVRSITPKAKDVPESVAEFKGTMLLRTNSEVFITWTNEINKVWLAVIDLHHKKAVVGQTFAGLTSVGGDLETLDCR